MLNFSLATLSNEFLVGVAVAAIVISALVASSLFRNLALALAAGAVVLLYLQGGIGALIATSKVLETEIKATPDFSQGLEHVRRFPIRVGFPNQANSASPLS